MAARTSPAARSTQSELVITRIFDAPPSLVFKAWTEREHLVHWSAPRGFTITHSAECFDRLDDHLKHIRSKE